jgi:multiple sugar transport system ATP-binding protein
MAAVVLEHLSKIYANGIQAVNDMSLEIADGELMVVVGPSGCGKTTTLRLIAGLEEPSAGTIRIGDDLVNALSPHRRDVAMVFQRSVLYPHLDVRRNLSMSLQFRLRGGGLARVLLRSFRPARCAEAKARQRVMAERVTSAARLLGLEDVLDRMPGQLSGGQQQRVALGRAIVRRPGVFLLDEPLSHLDGQRRAELRHELHLLQQELRVTMIYVTHDQAEAMTLADRVAVMDQGIVQQVDRPQAIYKQPRNRFVAGFLGWPPINFVDGRLLPKDGRLCFGFNSCCLPLPARKAAHWQDQVGRPLTLGIRPEDVQFAAEDQQGARLSAEVVLVESLGFSCLVTLRHGDWQGVALVPGPGPQNGWTRTRLERESMVDIFFNMEQAHLFDRSTGLAVNSGRPAG